MSFDFDQATDMDVLRAEEAANAAGWRQQGFLYVHPSRGTYRVKDMDGWIDLCNIEGIDDPTMVEWECGNANCGAVLSMTKGQPPCRCPNCRGESFRRLPEDDEDAA